MRKALVITPEGDVQKITLDDYETDYFIISGAVGGYVERVPLGNHTMLMWLNEEGKIHSLPYNPTAQTLWDREYGEGTDYIVGTVVITGEDDDDGNTVGLTDSQIADLAQAIPVS
jgi:hypothetical protein